MRLTLRRRILRAGVIRACALIDSPWHHKHTRAAQAYPRLIRRLATSDV